MELKLKLKRPEDRDFNNGRAYLYCCPSSISYSSYSIWMHTGPIYSKAGVKQQRR